MPTPTQKIDLFDSQGMDDPPHTEEVATSYLQQLEGLEGLARREAVNSPPHYNQGNIEVIDAIEDWGLDFNAGNVVKYVARHFFQEVSENLYGDTVVKNYQNQKMICQSSSVPMFLHFECDRLLLSLFP